MVKLHSPCLLPMMLWLLLVSFVYSDVCACAWDIGIMSVQQAQLMLTQAANESDFHRAKYNVGIAKSSLDSASFYMLSCGCSGAYIEFSSAALHSSYALHATRPDEFVDWLNRAIDCFNSAILYLRSCASEIR